MIKFHHFHSFFTQKKSISPLPIFPLHLRFYLFQNVWKYTHSKASSSSSSSKTHCSLTSSHNLALSAREREYTFEAISQTRFFSPSFPSLSWSIEGKIDTILYPSKVKRKGKKKICWSSRRAHDGRKCGNRRAEVMVNGAGVKRHGESNGQLLWGRLSMESHGRARYADGILSTELDGSRFGGAVHHVDHRHYSKQQLSECTGGTGGGGLLCRRLMSVVMRYHFDGCQLRKLFEEIRNATDIDANNNRSVNR